MNDETINDKDANIPIMIFNIYVTIYIRLLFCVLHFHFGKTPKTQYKVKYYANPCYHVLNNYIGLFNFHFFGTLNELKLNIF